MINKAFLISSFLFLASFFAWASEWPGFIARENAPILVGNVQGGQTVKFTGTANFYKKTITEVVRPFSYYQEAQEILCDATFFELSEKQPLLLEAVTPRLRIIVGEKNIAFKDISQVKWKKIGDSYSFSGKLKIQGRRSENFPLYIHIPNASNAFLRKIGYFGNSCNASNEDLPQDWDLQPFEYLDQDQQEFSVNVD